MKKQPKFHRRAFLRGVGGTTLYIPFLSSLAPLELLAQSPGPQKRFYYWVGRFGRDLKRWYPTQDPTSISPEGVYYSSLGAPSSGIISPILGSDFDPVRSKMTLIRGLDCMQSRADAHSSGVPTSASGWENSQLGFGYSIDSVLEESRKFNSNNAPVGALRISPESGGYQFGTSFTSRTGSLVLIPPERRLMDIYNKYFNPTSVQQQAQTNARLRPITNSVIEAFRSTMNSRRISSEDKHTLDNYMALLTQAEAKLGVTVQACQRGKQPAAAFTNSILLHQTAIDLEVAALACGLTNVIVHCNINHDSDIVPNDGEAHSSAHNGISDPKESKRPAIDQWILNKFAMSRFADLLKTMDSVQESNGTLLDNTLVMYGNLESRGFHNMNDLPVIMAGAKGRLKQGLYLDYRPRPLKVINGDVIAGRPFNNALISAFRILGLQSTDYERLGRNGFGVYDQFDVRSLGAHYAPFIAANKRNEPLPYLLSPGV